MAHSRRGFGRIEKRSSGRWRGAYTGPDLILYRAPGTFATKVDAEGWLATEKRKIDLGTWKPPSAVTDRPKAAVTLGEYAAAWLADRTLKPRTREHYAKLLANQLLPTFATTPLTAITPHKVRTWHTGMGTSTPTLRAHAYALLRTILGKRSTTERYRRTRRTSAGPATPNASTRSSPRRCPSWKPSPERCRRSTS